MSKEENVLPVGFSGTFMFTNARETEFKAKWNSIEYTFPPMSTSPMIIPGEPIENVQSIRKKFAREWAIEEWYKTPKFDKMNNIAPGGTPSLYTDSDLAPFIQKCLEPLPIASSTAKALPKDNEANYTQDAKGRPVTRVLEGNENLKVQDSAPLE